MRPSHRDNEAKMRCRILAYRHYYPEPPTPTVIDSTAFPHILSAVLAHADTKALMVLRRVSRDLNERSDARLARHLVIYNSAIRVRRSRLWHPRLVYLSPKRFWGQCGRFNPDAVGDFLKAHLRIVDVEESPNPHLFQFLVWQGLPQIPLEMVRARTATHPTESGLVGAAALSCLIYRPSHRLSSADYLAEYTWGHHGVLTSAHVPKIVHRIVVDLCGRVGQFQEHLNLIGCSRYVLFISHQLDHRPHGIRVEDWLRKALDLSPGCNAHTFTIVSTQCLLQGALEFVFRLPENHVASNMHVEYLTPMEYIAEVGYAQWELEGELR